MQGVDVRRTGTEEFRQILLRGIASCVRYSKINVGSGEHIGGVNRSPRWSSGNPRMLLQIVVLVLEFESRRGEILNLFAI